MIIFKKNKNKNKNDRIEGKNGIIIDDDISFAFSKQLNNSHFKLIQFIITLVAAISTVFIAVSFTQQNVSNINIMFFICAIIVAFVALLSSNKTLKLASIVYMILHIFFLLFNFQKIKFGFIIVINSYLTRANQINSTFGTYLSSINPIDYQEYTTYFFMFLGTIIVCLLAISCLMRIDFPLMFITTFPFIELGIYWGWNPPIIYAVGLVISWVMIITLHIINHTTNKAGINNTFAVDRKSKSYYFTSHSIKNSFFTVYARFVAKTCVIIFVCVILFSAITGFVRTERLNDYRNAISIAVEDFSFSKFQNMFSDYDGGLDFFNVKTVGGTNGGVLGTKNSISFNGSTALKVKTTNPGLPLYLRGYVAGKYEDNRWSEIEFKNVDFDFFDNQDMYVQDYNYYLSNLFTIDDHFGEFCDERTIEITVVGASKKFAYAPYYANYSSDTNTGGDKLIPEKESFVSLGKKNYSLKYNNLSKLSQDWNSIISNLEYMDLYSDGSNNSYANFVKTYYTDVPNLEGINLAYQQIKDMYIDDYTFSKYSTNTRIIAIQNYFNAHYTYSLSPGATPEGEDFIDYFLTEQDEAYCSYFASAGVMLMRKFGYPARYVEGYVINTDEFSDDDSEQDITVSDKSAHAWCEIYLENIGWVPCEFTPGYDSGNPNLVDDSSSSSSIDVESSSKNSSSSLIDDSKKSSTTTTTKTNKNNSDDSSKILVNSNINSGQSGNIGTKKVEFYWSIIIYIISFVTLIALVFIRRKVNLNKKDNLLNSNNYSQNIQNIYRYYMKYLNLISISSDKNITDSELIKVIINQCKTKNIDSQIEKDLKVLSKLAIKAYMSNSQMTENDSSIARRTLDNLENVVYSKLSTFKKLSAKWIKNLF